MALSKSFEVSENNEQAKMIDNKLFYLEDKIEQIPIIRKVKELGDGKCMLPYDWNGISRNFYFTRTYNPDGFRVKIKQLIDGEEQDDVSDKFYQASINTFNNVLGEVLNQVIGQGRKPVPEKGEKAGRILFEKATEFDGYGREVIYSGLNKVEFPYDFGFKKCDITFLRLPNGNIEISSVVRSLKEDHTLLIKESSHQSIDFEEFKQFSGTRIGAILDELIYEYGPKTPERTKVPEKANQVLKYLTNPNIDKVFAESDFVKYKKDKYTYGMTLKYYEENLKQYLDFGKIPNAEHFSVILNAVLDYNKGIFEGRHPETTDDFFLPKDIQYYKDYINEVEKTTFAAGNVKELSERKILRTTSDQIEFLLTYGRNGFMKVGNRRKKKLENYQAMQKNYLNKPLGGSTRFEFIREKFNHTQRLSPMLRALGPYIPMQESSYKNEKAKDNGLYTAGGLWQLTKPIGRKYELEIAGGVDDRMDIGESTKAAISYLGDIYQRLEGNKDYKNIAGELGLNKDEHDLLLTFLTINAYNAGEGNMTRALHTIRTSVYAKKSFDAHVKKYGNLGFILYITNDYPKHYKAYQKGITYKYRLESPEYVYNILRYYQIATKQKKSK